MTMRETTIAAAVAAALGLAGGAVAQTAQQVNPSPMPPGSRAGDAPGMSPGQAQTPGGPADRGVPGGTGAQAPSAQPDVQRGTAQTQAPRAPGSAATQGTTTTQGTNQGATSTQGTTTTTQGTTTRPGTTMPGTTGATTPGVGTQGGGTAALMPGANSFTEGQARARISDAGFSDVQDLRLDDQGIWRGRAMRNGQQTSVGLDYQGNVASTQ